MADKYTDDEKKALMGKGQAMPNANGDPSFPIGDPDDVTKAIHAVPLGGQDPDAIRAHIIKAAAKVGASEKIPDTWNDDGTLKPEQKAATPVCPTCDGSGTIREGNMECPDCNGTGNKVEKKSARRLPRQRRDLGRAQEFRQITATMEVRGAATEGSDIVLDGMPIKYAAPYDVHDALGTFRETMHPGVIAGVLNRPGFDCRFLINHNGVPLARTASGTLELEDRADGVHATATLDARSSAARDLAVAVERGDLDQMSCGFVVAKDGDEWSTDGDGGEQRDVYAFDELFDVSGVTYPASPTTTLALAQRMLSSTPLESRERLRRLYGLAKDIREGKVLSQANGQDLMAALEALHAADDADLPDIVRRLEDVNSALDKGQAALSTVLGRANPDGDAGDLQPALAPPDSAARARQRQALMLVRHRLLASR